MSGRPGWVPERAVDIHAAASAARAHVLDVGRDVAKEVGAPRLVGQGWDNAIISLGQFYLRVSVRAVGDACATCEQAVLPAIQDLPLRVPRPVVCGGPEPGLPGPWMVFEPVPGRELATLLADGGEVQNSEEVGRFLASLHRPDRVTPLATSVLAVDPLGRADPAVLAKGIERWRRSCAEAHLDVPHERLTALLATTELGPPEAPVALVHGDLHLRHPMVDAGGRVVGVIDWGDVCLAPPVGDLALLWYALLPGQRAALLNAYGPVDKSTLAASRRWAAYACLALMAASLDTGDEVVLLGAREGLRRVLIGVG